MAVAPTIRPRRRSRRRRRRPSAQVRRAEVVTEKAVQKAVIQYLTLLGWYVTHFPAGGESAEHRHRMRSAGTQPGFPDLYAEPPDVDRPPVLIECKRPGGRLSDEQRLCHAELRSRGRDVWIIDDPAQLWEVHNVWPEPAATANLRDQLSDLLGELVAANPKLLAKLR